MEENVLAEEVEEQEVQEEETQETEAEVKEPEEQPQDTTPPWLKKRIDKITWEKHEEARKREAAEEKIKQLEAEVAKAKQAAIPAGKPRIEDFDTDESYFDALTDWKLEQRDAKRREDERAAKQAEAEKVRLEKERRAQQTFHESVAEVNAKGAEKYPDYQDAINSIPNGVMTVELAELIFETDKPEDVAYHLAKNPKEAAKISKLSPSKKAVALGKIEARLSTKKASEAPPPIEPVKASGENFDADTLLAKDPARWIQLRNEGKI